MRSRIRQANVTMIDTLFARISDETTILAWTSTVIGSFDDFSASYLLRKLETAYGSDGLQKTGADICRYGNAAIPPCFKTAQYLKP